MSDAGASSAKQLRAALAVDALEQRAAEDRIAGSLFGTEPRPPEIAGYVLIAVIGSGAHGTVWSAYHRPTRRRVALKLLAHGDRRAEARAEARALARLSHPNVVAVFDSGSHDGRAFIAMEQIDGVTLTAWLAEQPRALVEILACFEQCARGLAAAHGAGVAHRDFKPSNVLIGRTETAARVCVGDFGLATLPEHGPAASVAGTPAYMAPELLRGGPADARSDQHAFFVALYEALAGARPYRGDDDQALRTAILGGARRPLPGASAALRRVIDRGLAGDPTARFPGMESVATALRAVARARTRRRDAALLLGVLGVGVTIAYVSAERTPECEDADAARGRIWSEPTRARVLGVLASTQPGASPEISLRAQARLDPWVEQWSRARAHACELVADAGSNAMALEQTSCLKDLEREFVALADVLATTDIASSQRALEAIASLGAVTRCDDPDARVSIDAELSEQLARAQALRLAGRPAEAVDAALHSLAHARTLGDPPGVARTLVVLARAREDVGQYIVAAQTLEDAFAIALSARDDAAAAAAARRLVHVEGYLLEHGGSALRWQREAESLHHALGITDDSLEGAELLASVGALAEASGEHDRALRATRSALDIRERRLDPGHPELARAYNNLGVVLDSLADYDGALAAHQRALELREAVHGHRHPSVATSLHNLGFVRLRQGDLDRAEADLRDALAIREAVLGSAHPDVASSHANLATVLLARGRTEAARTALQRALVIARGTWPDDHPYVQGLLARLAALDDAADRG